MKIKNIDRYSYTFINRDINEDEVWKLLRYRNNASFTLYEM